MDGEGDVKERWYETQQCIEIVKVFQMRIKMIAIAMLTLFIEIARLPDGNKGNGDAGHSNNAKVWL